MSTDPEIAKLRDPKWFVPRMRIEHKDGGFRTLAEAGMTEIQSDWLDVLCTSQNALCLKSRQLHITTTSVLYLVHQLLMAAGALRALTITHELGAVGRVQKMVTVALEGLPRELRPKLAANNMKQVEIDGTSASWQGLMAGGRGQARSWTYQILHATEMGLWPKGSSAREGMAVDEDVWASAQSTLHAAGRRIVESTADGPGGVFYKQVQIAQTDPKWAFRFYPWHKQPAYQEDPGEGFVLRADEEALAAVYGLTDRQIAWRRNKLETQGYTLERFRKEYPINPMDPFLLSGGTWFDVDQLQTRLALLVQQHPKRLEQASGLTYYHPPEEGRRYSIGVDPSAGVGGDEAVIQVLRDDMVQAATFASRTTKPQRLADIAARLYGEYGKPPVVVERNNKWGTAVARRLEALGVALWLGRDGKPWWTDERTKNLLLDYAAVVVDGGFCTIEDPLLLQQLIVVREQSDGKIEADAGANDDRAMGFFLALWGGRRIFSAGRKNSLTREIAERARVREERMRAMGLR